MKFQENNMIISFRIFFLKKVLKSRLLFRCIDPLIMTNIGTAQREIDSKRLVISQFGESIDSDLNNGAVQCMSITKKIATVLNKSK